MIVTDLNRVSLFVDQDDFDLFATLRLFLRMFQMTYDLSKMTLTVPVNH